MRKFVLILVFMLICSGFTPIVNGAVKGTIVGPVADKPQDKGALVIVGGALDPNNEEIYDAFLNLAMEYRETTLDTVKIAIVPTASASPYSSANSYKQDFVHYGVQEDHITILPIAVSDDDDTEDIDESLWADNGMSEELASTISDYDAVWFVGGNQLLYTETLLTDLGEDGPVLREIRSIYESGAVLGGSSAGAAIMSDTMIGAGTSLGALNDGVTYTDNYDDPKDNRVFLTQGLGFFDVGVVDQHFIERGRFGRLIVAASHEQDELAFGVDENTAMVVRNADKTITAIGESGVMIFDFENAIKEKDTRFSMSDIKVSYIEKGDVFHLDTKTFDIIENRDTTKGYEYYTPNPMTTDIFVAGALPKVLTYDLVDNEAKEAKALGFEMKNDVQGNGFIFTFRETDETEGYWGKIDGVETYAALNVMMDISPMDIKLSFKKQRNGK
ncbi:cyanophycinase [Bacillus sp. HMF5848]|uniref:cyanophycinase n=1 Tax=Bacillus sp. HMF5848 TaxID=2495421 RepID=UPI000F7A3FC4|nr:cyanophycinase [Bacillus sp. HMF5848]RSK27179.1 cyanophycinase [Bacillus sp. HMF5848]